MMRDLLVVASVFVAACGTVEAPSAVEPIDDDSGEHDAGVEPGPGSDAGTGSGSGELPGCMKASECDSGMACDIVSHECVTGMLTIEQMADVIVDGSRWWTSTTAPTLRGTFSGPSYAIVKVSVGTGAPISATLQGSAWSLQLPPGSIQSTDTQVTIVTTDPSGGAFEIAQTFVYDAAGPVIALSPSTVKDERGDTIDFSKGEPFHTHAGAMIDLGAAGCPVVYKYGYLLDATPQYGVSTSPNPLAWRFKVSDMRLAPSTQAFRVRAEDGTVLLNWTALPTADASGVSTFELTRIGGTFALPALGTRTGKYYVEVRARDWSNNETVKSWCWDHRPMQPPVSVAPFAQGSLFGLVFAADMPAAHLLQVGGEVDVVTQTIAQQTAEPTTITWSATSSTVSFAASTFDGHVTEEKVEQVYCLNGTTDPKCNMSWNPGTTGGYTSQGGSFAPTLSIAVIDVATGQVFATSATPSITVTLPARAAGQSARLYQFVVKTAHMPSLRPPSLPVTTTYGHHELFGLRYTGTAPGAPTTHCALVQQTQWGPLCQRVAYHWRFAALDRARLELSLTSRIQQGGADVTYVSSATPASGTLVWDSGDDDLPGAY